MVLTYSVKLENDNYSTSRLTSVVQDVNHQFNLKIVLDADIIQACSRIAVNKGSKAGSQQTGVDALLKTVGKDTMLA